MNVKKDRIVVLIVSIVLTTALSVLVIKGVDRTSDMTASVRDAAGSKPCPSDMVFVDSSTGGFCVDKYENAPGSDCPYQVPVNQVETRMNLNDAACQPVSVLGTSPWTNVSQDQAENACAKAGKRLPTNEEWYQAALGTPDEESGWGAHDCHVDNNWDLQPGLAGSAEKCVSSAGAYDMIGNVWEWVKGAVSEGIYEENKLPQSGYVISTDGYSLPGNTTTTDPDLNYNSDYFWIKPTQVRGFMRGGYWNNQSDAGIYSVYLAVPPSFSGVGVGFRCAK